MDHDTGARVAGRRPAGASETTWPADQSRRNRSIGAPADVASAADATGPGRDSDPFLIMSSLTKKYGPTTALDSLDLTINEGEFFCLLGPSGCGKSTTLGIVAGLLEATSGSLTLKGASLRGKSANERRVGYVFQDYALFPHMSAYENIAYGLRARKAKPAYIKQRVGELLQLVRLEQHAHRVPGQLSGGQQQRVAVARALAVDPTMLLLDEPLSNLDAQLRLKMQIELARIHRETGLTTILVTHDREEAFALADRIALLKDGRLQQVGTSEDLYRQPESRFVAEFMGRANFFEVTVDAGGSSAVATTGERTLPVAAETIASQRGARGYVLVRPQSISIHEPSTTDTGRDVLEGTIVARSYRGSFVLLEIDAGFATVQVEARPEEAPRDAAGRVALSWPSSAGLFLSE